MKSNLRPNGAFTIDLPWTFAWVRLAVIGGPYDAYEVVKSKDTFGVCVRAEQTRGRQIDVHLPIEDFSVPEDTDAVEKALEAALKAAFAGKTLYIGCMGGWGRTGLFLALLVKALGIKDPVGYVREHYHSHAVETKMQKLYVDTFECSAITAWARREAWKARLRTLF